MSIFLKLLAGGGNERRVLVIKFEDGESSVFDEITRALEQHPDFEQFRLRNESMLSLPGLEIFIRRRKVYSGYTEIFYTYRGLIWHYFGTKKFNVNFIVKLDDFLYNQSVADVSDF